MMSRIATRAAFAAAASLAVIAPLAGCTSDAQIPPVSTPPASPASTSPASTRSDTGSRSPGTSSGYSGSEYANGTYTVRGFYGSVPSYLTVTITLADGTISDVTVTPMPENNDTSRGYQERFAAAVPDEVIGKPIADLTVGKLAGASGCTAGFNNALDKIRAQATTNQ